VFIGVCETIGGIALLFPNFAFWAACGLFAIMMGAIYSHMTHGQAALWAAPVLAAYMLGFVAWVRRPQAVLLSSQAQHDPAPQEVKV
jgi:uncharacterized membrane protein